MRAPEVLSANQMSQMRKPFISTNVMNAKQLVVEAPMRMAGCQSAAKQVVSVNTE